MPKPKHDTSERTPARILHGNDDGSYGHTTLQTALLYNIRDSLELLAERQRQAVRVLERIDRRLAKQIKLR